MINIDNIIAELMSIEEDFSKHLNNPNKYSIKDFTLEVFEQLWGNTSGGMEGIGGSAMTWMNTYVFIPIEYDENIIVYFGGNYGYSISPDNIKFKEDLLKRDIKGKVSSSKYNY